MQTLLNAPTAAVTIVQREDIANSKLQEIFNTETHHQHAIVKYADGNHLYWEKNPSVSSIMESPGGSTLEELLDSLVELGHDKNSEIYRQLYRDSGCSLFSYYETFYIPNFSYNPSEYIPGKK